MFKLGSVFQRTKKAASSEIEVTCASHFAKYKKKAEERKSTDCFVVTHCYCCGSPLKHPENVEKLKCIRCHSTVELRPRSTVQTAATVGTSLYTFEEFHNLVDVCNARYSNECCNLGAKNKKDQLHDIFRPIEDFVEKMFASVERLNYFCMCTTNKSKVFDSSVVSTFYNMIINLPTSRPLYKLLVCSNERLKRPKIDLRCCERTSSFLNFRWVLMIMEMPLLRESLLIFDSKKMLSPHMRAILYDVLKRCIGYMSSLDGTSAKEFVRHLQGMSAPHFVSHVDLLNIYLTFHFSRIMRKKFQEDACQGSPDLEEFCSDIKLNPKKTSNDLEIISRMVSKIWKSDGHAKTDLPHTFKFDILDYGNDWHIKTVAKLSFFYYTANQCKWKCPVSRFYNVLSDYLDYKKDYDECGRNWKCRDFTSPQALTKATENMVLIPYYPLTGQSSIAQFAMCQYPYLLSLGIKISIMEREIRKVMEHSAEQAFLKALDKKQVIEVYLRIRIRRSNVAQDSLHCIEAHRSDLQKSLRVEFVNEPGIDAGGLRKEWFSLLIKELISSDNGLFVVVDESRFSWFNVAHGGTEGASGDNLKLNYLFGIVLGLAIYNGTILDVCFPMALYKKLCGAPINRADFLELYPVTGKNLIKMMEYEGADFEGVFSLNFEITYLNVLGSGVCREELCDGGTTKQVTMENRSEYVRLWIDFYMNKSIAPMFEAFANGFYKVVKSDAFRLFSAEEVEQLLCGSHETNIDVDTLKSVTKYGAGFSQASRVIDWFWSIFDRFSAEQKRKLLEFVTGSDRIPATGISTIPFKITRLGGDSDRLPLAHTCFNELCIYDYGDRNKLQEKLSLAMHESEGYGFK
ncbi:LADA_0H18184g1_1 [Lachancea dasiensis]|uniref:HECT-type E3 ubiquitin transferase n=1 Tax=Lachancea dasiensis TaxID=1072105 RepID=A0A1G4K5W8_9SACH|nr:LADA_0H18184g1_1 [Lachancea dasiensis]